MEVKDAWAHSDWLPKKTKQKSPNSGVIRCRINANIFMGHPSRRTGKHRHAIKSCPQTGKKRERLTLGAANAQLAGILHFLQVDVKVKVCKQACSKPFFLTSTSCFSDRNSPEREARKWAYA